MSKDAFDYVWQIIKAEEEDDAYWEKLHDEQPERFDEDGIYHPEEKRLNEQTPDYPIEYEDACPHCGANPLLEEVEHDLIDYGLDGDYYQTYKCFNCSGEWENRYSFSGVVKR